MTKLATCRDLKLDARVCSWFKSSPSEPLRALRTLCAHPPIPPSGCAASWAAHPRCLGTRRVQREMQAGWLPGLQAEQGFHTCGTRGSHSAPARSEHVAAATTSLGYLHSATTGIFLGSISEVHKSHILANRASLHSLPLDNK